MSKQSRERLAKALQESRRAEKDIIDAEAREDDEQADRLVDELERSRREADDAAPER
jgi:hypothetical protein